MVAVSRTDHVPAAKLSVGFWAVGVPAKFDHPEPLFFSHSHEVGVFVDESVNATEREAAPDVGVPVKSATGAVAPGGITTSSVPHA